MGYQAITTKFLAPTNTKGSRVKATAAAGSVTVAWDYGKSTDENHRSAAQALAQKFGWIGKYVGGGLPDGSGNVYVLLGTDDTFGNYPL